MELNEHIVISFLLVVIVILIFSKISISTGLMSDSTSTEQSPSETPTQPAKINIQQSKMSSSFEPQNSDLLSDDFKKQLNDLNNQFYTNVCPLK
jgi:hypothetical protein